MLSIHWKKLGATCALGLSVGIVGCADDAEPASMTTADAAVSRPDPLPEDPPPASPPEDPPSIDPPSVTPTPPPPRPEEDASTPPPPADASTPPDEEMPAIVVALAEGARTSEAGEEAEISVSLATQPTSDVVIAIASSDESEGRLWATSLLFTPASYRSPQIVRVTGLDDAEVDGDQSYRVVFAPAESADPKYDGMDADDVELTNDDDETAGISVMVGDTHTTEDGGEATFDVRLDSRPSADVRIPVSSSNPSEGRVWLRELVFTPESWDSVQTVRVSGVDDEMLDRAQPFTVVLGAAESEDAAFAGIDPMDVEMTNEDDETASIRIAPATGLETTERGGTASFTVTLSVHPMSPVMIPITSSDENEGTPSTTMLTFDPATFYLPQTVTVTGGDDHERDGDRTYTITVGPSDSSDPVYRGVERREITLRNLDDEQAGIVTTPRRGGETSERGAAATFQVSLLSRPMADVYVPLVASDAREGAVSPSMMRFTRENWADPQIATATGQNDDIVDGTRGWSISLGPTTSSDPEYDGLRPAPVELVNFDDDTPGITVQPTESMMTSEGGAPSTFTIVLDSQPSAPVTVELSSDDETAGLVSPSAVTFLPSDWSTPRMITVAGVDDDLVDGLQEFQIITSPASSDDPGYAALDAADVKAGTMDDDVVGVEVGKATNAELLAEGESATFEVSLSSQPLFEVVIPIEISDPLQATCDVTELRFAPGAWNVPQNVVVTAVAELDDDGDSMPELRFLAATSADMQWAGFDATDFTLTVVDDDIAD